MELFPRRGGRAKQCYKAWLLPRILTLPLVQQFLAERFDPSRGLSHLFASGVVSLVCPTEICWPMVGLRRDANQRLAFPGPTRSENECGFRSRLGAFAT